MACCIISPEHHPDFGESFIRERPFSRLHFNDWNLTLSDGRSMVWLIRISIPHLRHLILMSMMWPKATVTCLNYFGYFRHRLVAALQRLAGLTATGIYDSLAAAFLDRPRCGVRDQPGLQSYGLSHSTKLQRSQVFLPVSLSDSYSPGGSKGHGKSIPTVVDCNELDTHRDTRGPKMGLPTFNWIVVPS
jgi:hypothetical protein